MLTSIKHILPQTIVQRLRQMPIEGRVKVRQGQTVRATDVIGTTVLKPRHTMLDVAAGLGVSRLEAGKHIERYEDESVQEGDVIARKTGLFSRIVRSPVSGKIVLLTDGYVMIEEKQDPFKLLAGLPGEVIDLIHNLGAVIETTGALVQGVWGNGRIDSGVLTVAAEGADSELTPDRIDVSLRGAVLMGGWCASTEAFRRASEQRLRGLIIGRMPSELIPAVRKLDFPVILTDGFGRGPMNKPAFRLLSTSDQREIAINAEPFNPETAARPEAVLPLQAAPGIGIAPPVGRLEVGRQVQITRAPHQGSWGTVVAFLPGRTLFENGLRLAAAAVRLESGESVHVPLANLEIVNNN